MALLDLSQHRCDDTENVKAAQLGRRPHRCMHLCVESARHGSNGWFPGLLHWRRMSFPAMLNPGSMEQEPLIVRLFVRTAVALAAAALAAIAHTPAASSLPKAEVGGKERHDHEHEARRRVSALKNSSCRN